MDNNTLIFKLPNQSPLQVNFSTAEYGSNGCLYLYHNGDIVATIGGRPPSFLADELHRAAEKFTHWRSQPDVLNITPAQVIAYFEQSPILVDMADDVRAALEPLVKQNNGHNPDVEVCLPHRDEIIDETGQIRRGAQSRVAEILHIYNAGPSYRKRINNVLEALKTSSSTRINIDELGQTA